jgi:hypothetical protein
MKITAFTLRSISVALAACCVCAGLSACTRRPPADGDSIREGIVVLPDATDVRKTRQNNAVVYLLTAPFPATPVIEALNTRLTNAGWKPLRNDVLNPSSENSFDKGWSQFQDALRSPDRSTEKFQWQGQWQDSSGDVVIYELEYDGTLAEGHVSARGPLRVSATRLSPDRVKALQGRNRAQMGG